MTTPSEQDWPAAHSMDTEWYAVDKCGHIAKFFTGEAGALPKTGQHDNGLGGMLNDYLQSKEMLQGWSETALGMFATALRKEGQHNLRKEAGEPGLFILTWTEEPKQMLFGLKLSGEVAKYREVTAGKEKLILLAAEMPKHALDLLHQPEAPICQGCYREGDETNLMDIFGVFSYSPGGGNDAIWPYECNYEPEDPSTVEELGFPRPALEFDFCFGDKPKFQVTAYAECALYGDDYEDLIIPEEASAEEIEKILSGKKED